MKLYHGTNADIGAIDLNRGLRHKDFGKGFYLTPDLTTAIRMAQKKTRLFGGKATLITYEMDEAALHSDFKTGISTSNIISERRRLYAFCTKQM